MRHQKRANVDIRVKASEEAARKARATTATARRMLEDNNLALIVNAALGIKPRERRDES